LAVTVAGNVTAGPKVTFGPVVSGTAASRPEAADGIHTISFPPADTKGEFRWSGEPARLAGGFDSRVQFTSFP
jgi:hypothetical protein